MSIENILYELYERHTRRTGKLSWEICVSVRHKSGLIKGIPPFSLIRVQNCAFLKIIVPLHPMKAEIMVTITIFLLITGQIIMGNYHSISNEANRENYRNTVQREPE